ncbi:MAG: hypothetical protein Q8Q13_03405 [bacterium]|nr:hypothetical protein [bacterium]
MENMEKASDAPPGPSREELRQISKSKTTGEFSGATPTPEQAASRATDDARVAELRESLGLEPELSDRRGLGDEHRVQEGQAKYWNGFGQPVLAPRSEYADREVDRVSGLKELKGNIELAKSIGIEVPTLNLPDKDDPAFNKKIHEEHVVFGRTVRAHYENFAKNLKDDPEMRGLLRALSDAERSQREATSGRYGELARTELSPLRLNLRPKRIFYSALHALGGSSVVEKGQATMRKTDAVRDQIVALMCKRFEDAGLNKAPSFSTPVTLANSNWGRVKDVMGINIMS